MSNNRVLVMMNEYTVPPERVTPDTLDRDSAPWIMQYDVISHLKKLNFDVAALGLADDIHPLKALLDDFKPSIVFNLIYEFAGEAILDQNVISFLELLQIPYTGCNPRSLTLARNKATTKQILHYHGIPTPRFVVFPKDQALESVGDLHFPIIVKCLAEEGSIGITKASLVHNEEKLKERVLYLHEHYKSDAIAEEFIAGRELSVGVLGNKKIVAFPAWELVFAHSESPEQEFYHTQAKWHNGYRKRKGIQSQRAVLDARCTRALTQMAKRTYKALGLNGYARIDFRMTSDGSIFVIEANPNPDIGLEEDFAVSANAAGLSYDQLLKRIVSLGLQA